MPPKEKKPKAKQPAKSRVSSAKGRVSSAKGGNASLLTASTTRTPVTTPKTNQQPRSSIAPPSASSSRSASSASGTVYTTKCENNHGVYIAKSPSSSSSSKRSSEGNDLYKVYETDSGETPPPNGINIRFYMDCTFDPEQNVQIFTDDGGEYVQRILDACTPFDPGHDYKQALLELVKTLLDIMDLIVQVLIEFPVSSFKIDPKIMLIQIVIKHIFKLIDPEDEIPFLKMIVTHYATGKGPIDKKAIITIVLKTATHTKEYFKKLDMNVLKNVGIRNAITDTLSVVIANHTDKHELISQFFSKMDRLLEIVIDAKY